jgi:phage/plasmid primase-like uncharacterized protein
VDDAAKGYGGDGWLWIHPDGHGFHIQNWRQDDKPESYRLPGAPDAHPLLRAAAKAQQSARRVMASEAAAECARVWDAAAPADPNHPYLVRKSVPYAAGELRQIPAAPAHLGRKHAALVPPVLLVPGYREGELKPTALTYIDIQGTKLWHPHCAIDGQFCVMGSGAWATPGTIYIAEGIATAASIAAAMKRPCVVAFDAGNLPKAAKRVRSLRPNDELVVCADDDWRLPKNKGAEAGRKAAEAVGARLVTPDFSGVQRGESDTDFNDLACLAPEHVAACLAPGAGVLAPAAWMARATVDDFYMVLSQNRVYYRPTGDLCEKDAVSGHLGREALKYLSTRRAVTSMCWAPGEPELIHGRELVEGGWVDSPRGVALNLYKPRRMEPGNADGAERWVEHVKRVWPDDAEHLFNYFAHRAQRPGEKINHALLLIGAQGIGKDTALKPLQAAVGSWNYKIVSPRAMTSQFNPWAKSVVLLVNEAHDLGDTGRYAFAEMMKAYEAEPPDTTDVNEKHRRQYRVLNVVAVIYTSNHALDALYIPRDSRRHYVALSKLTRDMFKAGYFDELYAWLTWQGGLADCVAWLLKRDISTFNPKTPPKITDACARMMHAETSEEVNLLDECIRAMGSPPVLSLAVLRSWAAGSRNEALTAFLADPKQFRNIPRRLEECEYELFRNPDDARGRWMVGNVPTMVYGRRDIAPEFKRRELSALSGEVIIRAIK